MYWFKFDIHSIETTLFVPLNWSVTQSTIKYEDNARKV